MAFLDSQLHINVPLTDFAVAYRADLDGYMWSKLLPPKIVTKRSDYIRQIDKGNLLRKYDLRVGKGGRISEVQFKIGNNFQFNAVDYAVKTILRNSEAANADDILEYEHEQMYHALVAMHTNIEVITIKETLRDPAQLTNNVTLAAGSRWDDYTSLNSDPVDDFKIGIQKVENLTTKEPNIIFMHKMVWDRVQRHPRVLMRGGVHPTGGAIVSIEQFEKILGVAPGTIMVTTQNYNVALEDQTPDFRSMIGPDCIIARVETPSVRSYGLGCSFMFQGDGFGSNLQTIPELGTPFLVYQYPEYQSDPRLGTALNLVGGLDQKILVPDAGYLIKDCVTKTAARYGNFLNN